MGVTWTEVPKGESIDAGKNVRIVCSYTCVPFFCPANGDILAYLNNEPIGFTVQSVNDNRSFSGDQLIIDGVMDVGMTRDNIELQVRNTFQNFSTLVMRLFGFNVTAIKRGDYVFIGGDSGNGDPNNDTSGNPSAPAVSTQTTIFVVALAVIALLIVLMVMRYD